MERARDAQISSLRTLNKVLQKKCKHIVFILFPCLYYAHKICMYIIIFTGDELMTEDDDKQQLLNYVIQVCRPKDWQISLLEDRLAKRQLTISSSHSQKRLDSVVKGGLINK